MQTAISTRIICGECELCQSFACLGDAQPLVTVPAASAARHFCSAAPRPHTSALPEQHRPTTTSLRGIAMRLIQGRVPLAVAARPAVTSVPPVLLRRQARCVASEPAGLCRALSSSSTSSSGSMPAARWPLPRCSLPPAAAACSSAAAAPRRRPRAGAAPAQAEAAVAAAGASLEELRGALQLYNTMARTKQGLRPREGMGDKLQMYVCGVTVYDYSHIGEPRRRRRRRAPVARGLGPRQWGAWVVGMPATPGGLRSLNASAPPETHSNPPPLPL
jgi:hypothetical protein